MRIWKRGTVYWFEIEFQGRRYQKSTKAKNLKLAGQVASTFHTALIQGNVGITERKRIPHFKQAMAAFLDASDSAHLDHPATAVRYRTSSKALLKYFRDTPLDQITPEEVEKYRAARSAEKSKRTKRKLRPATVNRELACLRAMYNHVLKGDVLLRNPVSRVRFLPEDNQQDRVLKYAEQRAYLAAATPTLQDVAGLILETGMRPEEVYTLRDSNVDLEQGFLRVLKGKTPAAKRRIDLNDEARRIIERRLEAIGGAGYLFPHAHDASRPMPKVSNAHTRAVKASQVANFRLYDLRHTWATRAAEYGTDLVTLAAMMGHSRIQMVMRYAHPTQKHQSNATENIAQRAALAEQKEKATAAAAAERKLGQMTLLEFPRRA